MQNTATLPEEIASPNASPIRIVLYSCKPINVRFNVTQKSTSFFFIFDASVYLALRGFVRVLCCLCILQCLTDFATASVTNAETLQLLAFLHSRRIYDYRYLPAVDIRISAAKYSQIPSKRPIGVPEKMVA